MDLFSELPAEYATEPMGTTEMAAALKAGGVRSGGQNFVANVSAVVSDMTKKRQELVGDDSKKYEITPKGREAWESIRRSRNYRFRRIDDAPDVIAQS